MARIRTIKPEFFQDEKMAPLPPLDRLLFLGLISMADDCGRLLDNVKVIDAFVFPETSETCRDSLANLSRIGRIARGTTSSGQRVIQITNWSKHQKVDKPNNSAALPEIVGPSEDTSIREPFASDSRAVREPLALRPTTNDQRPTTDEDDLRAPARDILAVVDDSQSDPTEAEGEPSGRPPASDQLRVALGDYAEPWRLLELTLRSASSREAVAGKLLLALDGGTSPDPLTPEDLAGGIAAALGIADRPSVRLILGCAAKESQARRFPAAARTAPTDVWAPEKLWGGGRR